METSPNVGAFAGEEQGLLGSTLYAARSKKENQKIEAVLATTLSGIAQGLRNTG